MAEKITYEDFVEGLNPFDECFVKSMHNMLAEKGCAVAIKPAAQGPVVSYLSPKTKKTVHNYVFRKSGMQVRIYGDNICAYQDFLQTLPESMLKLMDKATQCRHCNVRCPKGYPVIINGKTGIKCRYSAFLFPLNSESAPFIKTFIENEISEREKI